METDPRTADPLRTLVGYHIPGATGPRLTQQQHRRQHRGPVYSARYSHRQFDWPTAKLSFDIGNQVIFVVWKAGRAQSGNVHKSRKELEGRSLCPRKRRRRRSPQHKHKKQVASTRKLRCHSLQALATLPLSSYETAASKLSASPAACMDFVTCSRLPSGGTARHRPEQKAGRRSLGWAGLSRQAYATWRQASCAVRSGPHSIGRLYAGGLPLARPGACYLHHRLSALGLRGSPAMLVGLAPSGAPGCAALGRCRCASCVGRAAPLVRKRRVHVQKKERASLQQTDVRALHCPANERLTAGRAGGR